MKRAMFWLLLSCGLLSAQAHAGTVTLTRADVTSARDIEAAIQSATTGGTVPGTVILDASAGPFEYTNGDRAININVSNLTLRSPNFARIVNCGDGLFFDNVRVRNILIEGIVFDCVGNGIAWFGRGPRERVTVQDNVIVAPTRGIVIGDSLGWTIRRNVGGTGDAATAIDLVGGANALVINNLLVGFFGVRRVVDSAVTSPRNHRIVNNRIESLNTGILLDDAATENRVIANRICVHTTDRAAILLGADTSNNRVQGNRIALVARSGSLVLVQDLGTANIKSNNTQGSCRR